MNFGLIDKVAIVTGAAQGMGRAIALAFANQGAHVVVSDISPDGVQDVAREVEGLGCEALPIVANVTNSDEVGRMVDTASKRFGRIDVLVNNAGTIRRVYIEDMTEETWNQVMDVNLKGVFLCSKAVIGPMKKQKTGKIINATSVLAETPDIGLAAYSISKAGIVTLTKVLAAELAPFNINVNAYAPGTIETPMTKDLITTRGKEKLKYISLARFGKPDDVANLVLFLASDLSSYITGAVVDISGGNLIVQRPWVSHEECV